jgi:hypothetical protein
MAQACSEATTKASEAETRLLQSTTTSVELLQEYRTRNSTLTALEQTGQEVQGHADQAREAAVKVIKARKDIAILADAACTKPKTLLTAGLEVDYQPLKGAWPSGRPLWNSSAPWSWRHPGRQAGRV